MSKAICGWGRAVAHSCCSSVINTDTNRLQIAQMLLRVCLDADGRAYLREESIVSGSQCDLLGAESLSLPGTAPISLCVSVRARVCDWWRGDVRHRCTYSSIYCLLCTHARTLAHACFFCFTAKIQVLCAVLGLLISPTGHTENSYARRTLAHTSPHRLWVCWGIGNPPPTPKKRTSVLNVWTQGIFPVFVSPQTADIGQTPYICVTDNNSEFSPRGWVFEHGPFMSVCQRVLNLERA